MTILRIDTIRLSFLRSLPTRSGCCQADGPHQPAAIRRVMELVGGGLEVGTQQRMQRILKHRAKIDLVHDVVVVNASGHGMILSTTVMRCSVPWRYPETG